MKIRLGLDLDGQHGEALSNQIDSLTTGPLGMLNVLETQLGLLRREVGHAERVLQYRDALSRLNSPERFYHATFSVDDLGTAATLLSWRDHWHLHGWSCDRVGFLKTASSTRLKDMADIESELSGKLAPCLGERLQLVSDALNHLTPRIDALTVSDPLANWPAAWQTILQRLDARFIPDPEGGASDCVLAEVQTTLRAMRHGQALPRIKWTDDGSFSVVRAETQLLAGRWLGEHLHTRSASSLLVVPNAGLLDDVLAAAQLPRQGFRDISAFRPALQVLPLALGQLWKPLDLFGLLKFLTHPICPVPAIARTRLAEMLASSPGIGAGPAWEHTLSEIQKACEKSGYDWKIARERISTWVENARFDSVRGAPIESVLDRVGMLANFFLGRLKDADGAHRNAFGSGHSQVMACQAALRALALQGETHIPRQQLETLVSQVTAQGVSNPTLRAEVGAARSVTRPGAALSPVENVFWWQLEAPVLPGSYPWSADECTALADAGIQLPSVDDLLDRESSAWQRPVMLATKSLTLVLPPPGGEDHPLWLLIKSIFDKDFQPRVKGLEEALEDSRLELQPFRPLPTRKRWWTLKPGILPKREVESFSSLESFLFNPYQWVLNYPAALRPSSILDVSDGFLLYGTLAHHLVEQFVSRSDALSMQVDVFESWFEEAFGRLIACEGAILLMPGRSEDMTAFKRKLKNAMCQLRQHFSSAGVVKVEAEHEFEGAFVGGKIRGYGDLLMTKADGSQAIVDMKWAGGKKYPGKLQENRHLQLAIYGELLRQKTGVWPKLAYFIISSGELIATDRTFFPDCRVVWKKSEVADEGAPQLWQRFIETWKWRRAQMDEGIVEVMLEMPEESDNPEEGLALEVLNQAYNNYLTLAGWEDEV